MATLAAQYLNVDSLIQNFIVQDLPFFAVYDSSMNILFKNESDEDINNASDKLKRFIKNIDPANRQIFIIRHFTEVPKGGIKKSSEPDLQSTYKNPAPEFEPNQSRYGNNDINRMMLEELREMRREINEMKMQAALLDSEDDEDVENSAQPNGILGAILGNPAITSVLVNLLTNIGANLATQRPPEIIRPTAMAGITPTETAILEKLYSKGVTIDDLQKISDMPLDKINFLLSMLRS